MPTILPPAKTTFLGPNGEVLSGGSVAFSIPGTTTPKNTYQDSDQTILNQNPVPLDANGQALIWGTGSYRQRVYDANENLIWDQITEDTTAGLLGNMTDEMGSGGTPGFAANVDFTPGTTTSLTLSTNYGSTPNLWVAFDAAEQGADSYSLSGTELTFVSPIPVGVNKVYVKGGSTIAIGTPGTGTITDASVAPGAAIQSSKLSYLQGGSGSVVRTILSRLQDYVSVKDFGATGNGTTDDTEAIQAALSWASAAGGSVYMPPGKYVVSSTLTITGSFVRLFGAGKSIATIAFSPSSGDTLLIGSATSALESVYVDGIGFAPSVTKTSGSEIHVNGNNINIYLVDLLVNKGFQGIYLDSQEAGSSGGGSSYHITNCYIESCTYAGVEIGSSNGWVQGVWMDECTIAANAHGLLIQNCSALYASRLDIIEQTVDGISVNPYNAGMYAIDLFFNNVQVDSTTGIGWSFPATAGIVGNVVCVNCWAANSSGPAGLYHANGNLDGFSWSNGQIISNAQHGVYLGAGNNINIQATQVFNNSQSSSGTYHGIVVAANLSGFKLMDNMCCAGGYQRLQGGANPQGWGILVAAGTGGDFWVVGNKCDGNVLGGYSNAATGANQKVRDNTFGAAFSTPAVPASGTTIINPAGRDIRVFISGGTFSSVGVNGNAIGIAGNNCDLILRAGENIGINYTSAPSWTMLDF